MIRLTRRIAVLALVVAGLVPGAVSAHHGSAASYDIGKQVTLTGVVTEVVWQNPHVFIMFDVTDGTGKVVNWGAETHPPAQMLRNRVDNAALPWSRNTVKRGDKVTITLFPSWVDTPRGLLAKVVSGDGKVLLDDGAGRTVRPRPATGLAR